MLRAILVVLHSAGGLGGVLVGTRLLRPKTALDRRLERRAYWLSLVGLLGSVVVMIGIDWPGLALGARTAFLALVGLGLVMLIRFGLAQRELATGRPGWQARYLGHVYFTYISLWVGFVILPALRLPLPQIAAPAAALAVLVVGNVLLARYKRRVLRMGDRQR